MLRTQPRLLSEAEVRAAVWKGLKVEAKIEPLERPGVNAKVYMVAPEGMPPLLVISSASGYMSPEETERVAKSFEDPRAREAIAGHKAWISIDLAGIKEPMAKELRSAVYNRVLGKIAAGLLDDGCTLLYLPSDGRFGIPGPGVADQLANAKVGDVFSDDDLHEPVIHVDGKDKAINDAIEIARKRLPELVAAFQARGGASNALIKGKFEEANGGVEYMWVKVERIDPTGFTGEMLNRPGLKGLPGRGESVSVPQDRVVDWMFTDETDKPHGGFVERVLRSK